MSARVVASKVLRGKRVKQPRLWRVGRFPEPKWSTPRIQIELMSNHTVRFVKLKRGGYRGRLQRLPATVTLDELSEGLRWLCKTVGKIIPEKTVSLKTLCELVG